MKIAMSRMFLRLYTLVFLYFSANALLNVYIPLRGDELGASNTTIGIIMGSYLFTTMFFRPWAGQIIQRIGPIRVLRFVLLSHGLALLLYAFTGLGGYFLARVLQGVTTAFFSMALQIGIIDSLPDKERSSGISLYSLFAYIPGIIGPLIAVGIWEAGMGYFTVTMLILAVLTALVGYFSSIDKNNEKSTDSSVKQTGSVLQAFQLARQQPPFIRCSAIMLIASIIFGAGTIFIPLYAREVDGASGAVFLMLMALTVVIARYTLKSRIPSDGLWHPFLMTGLVALYTCGALFLSLSVFTGTILFYSAAVLIGLAQALIYPTLTTYLSFVLPPTSRNVMLGLFIATADLGVSLGAAAMGPVIDVTSFSTMYLYCAILGMLSFVFVINQKKKQIK